MTARSIRYYPDSSESNDAPATATTLALGTTGVTARTFFGSGDEDWYQVTLIPGVLVAETFNLGDGADTNLELYASDGTTLLASNDDRSATDKSSLIQYSVITGGTFYLRVTNASSVE